MRAERRIIAPLNKNEGVSIMVGEKDSFFAALERRIFEHETKGKNPGWYRR